ncbi:MAG: acyl-CoA dehydrogenase family protein [Congregibacter sp.]
MSVIGSTVLRFDDEQAMLLDVARSFCASKGGLTEARRHLETPLDHSPELWQEIVQMGWTGIGLPESVGGAGLGIGAAVPVLESMGRALLGTPLMSSLLGAQLLLRLNSRVAETILSEIAAGVPVCVAELESEDWGDTELQTVLDDSGCLQGTKRMVMDLQSARYALVTARKRVASTGQISEQSVLAVIDTGSLPGAAVTPRMLIDNTHRAADLNLHAVRPTLVIESAGLDAAVSDYRLLGALLVAAESAGAAAACLDIVVDYLKTRKQFGKLIGSYQALKHPAVDILNNVDSSRSFIYHAASLLSGEPLSPDQAAACRMAKVQATDTLKEAGDRAVQFHGGMGFTWDCDAQLFIRRAQWAQQQFGDSQHHRKRLASHLLD